MHKIKKPPLWLRANQLFSQRNNPYCEKHQVVAAKIVQKFYTNQIIAYEKGIRS